MIIVAGAFEVDPDQRDDFLAGRLNLTRASRAEPGCLEYTFCADPLEPGRVVLFERWEDQESLNAHLAVPRAAAPDAGPQVAPKSAAVTVYDIAGERALGS